MSRRFVGIDVGAREWHCAALDESGAVAGLTSLSTQDGAALASWCAGAEVVAIDAPQAPSTRPHAGDAELAPKFRAARCAEIELGRRHGCWVSWVAPAAAPFPGWIEAGFAAYAALRSFDGSELLEVYPHAAFRELAGGRRPASKRSAAGRSERGELLASAEVRGPAAGVRGPVAGDLSHDALDALVAALVARDRGLGGARRVTCGHDDSALWLPARPPE